MAIAESTTRSGPFCSVVGREGGEDPTGSAATIDRLLLIEVPLPWPRSIRDAPRFPAAVEAALAQADERGDTYKLFGLVPDHEYTPDGLTRVIHARKPGDAFAVFDKEDYLVPPDQLGDLVGALLTGSPAIARFAGARQATTHLRDTLVCTHGTRDRCCATFGFPTYRKLRQATEIDGARPGRVWRVSHIGGHRFAPTMITLPDGRYWSHLDETTLDRIDRRDGELPDLRIHYRGWAAMGSLPEMLAERELFRRNGWNWTKRLVTSEIVVPTDPDTGVTVIRLTHTGPDGGDPHQEDLTIEPTGLVTRGIGSCGDTKVTESRHYRVSRVEQRSSDDTRTSLAMRAAPVS